MLTVDQRLNDYRKREDYHFDYLFVVYVVEEETLEFTEQSNKIVQITQLQRRNWKRSPKESPLYPRSSDEKQERIHRRTLKKIAL